MSSFLEYALFALALLAAAAAAAALRGPHFTDRLVAINLLSTLTLSMICLLSVYLREDFLMDVALIYALVSFVTVAVLSRLITQKYRRERKEESK